MFNSCSKLAISSKSEFVLLASDLAPPAETSLELELAHSLSATIACGMHEDADRL